MWSPSSFFRPRNLCYHTFFTQFITKIAEIASQAADWNFSIAKEFFKIFMTEILVPGNWIRSNKNPSALHSNSQVVISNIALTYSWFRLSVLQCQLLRSLSWLIWLHCEAKWPALLGRNDNVLTGTTVVPVRTLSFSPNNVCHFAWQRNQINRDNQHDNWYC